ncbi:uncharacterized protein LOC116515580 [Thamnophis elegans]|uniref:uncharacterized protein LOC116515580 n=1 Tax=Thamnophis elegans TaxID=35005 RepID=UPI0013787466|nr:uncharacterized protein LOC116515580 [Thamnophis elegans]
MSVLHFGAVLSSFISLLCLILALATDYWIANSLIGTRLGLWKFCKDHECYPLGVEFVSGSLRAVQSFMFLGMISGIVSLGGLCVLFWKPLLGKISMSSTALYGSFSAGLCVMIAMSIFTGQTAATYYGWSFGLGWASFPLYLLTGGLAYTLHRNLSASGRPVHPIEMSALHFGAVLSSFISLLFLILALATDYWIAHSGTRLGLWNTCQDQTCFPLSVKLVPGSIHAIRIFMFLGLISGVVSLGGLCVLFWKPLLGNISMSITACLASFTAGLCVMIAMSIFTGQIASTYYGWSFGLGWASFPLYLLTGGLAYTLHRSTAATA